MDKIVGAVIEHGFSFEPPAVANMTIHDFATGLSAPEARKQMRVDLREAAPKMEKHYAPRGIRWPRTI